MIKRIFGITVILCLAAGFGFAQDISDLTFESGNWLIRNNRLYQLDQREAIAKASFPFEQEGIVDYRFNVRFEGGVEDGHIGFGIHVFVDEPADWRSWGEGESWLLWFNFDSDPSAPNVPTGFSFQLYKSTNNLTMEIVESADLSEYTAILPLDSPMTTIPMHIRVNGDTGEVRIYNPQNPALYWPLELPIEAPISGDYVTLRTNSMAISWGQ
ncbi:MAG: hypothetical protein ACLFR1_14470 [Spirochaetia bacterium]